MPQSKARLVLHYQSHANWGMLTEMGFCKLSLYQGPKDWIVRVQQGHQDHSLPLRHRTKHQMSNRVEWSLSAEEIREVQKILAIDFWQNLNTLDYTDGSSFELRIYKRKKIVFKSICNCPSDLQTVEDFVQACLERAFPEIEDDEGV